MRNPTASGRDNPAKTMRTSRNGKVHSGPTVEQRFKLVNETRDKCPHFPTCTAPDSCYFYCDMYLVPAPR